MTKSYRVGLIGAGAIGLYYTSFFADLGCSITLFTRHPEDYEDSKVMIDSIFGQRFFLIDYIESYQNQGLDSFDCLIIATKALPSIDIVNLTKHYVSQKTVILIIQNGLHIEGPLLTYFNQPIIRGLAFICTKREAMNRVKHMAYGDLTLGLVQGEKEDDRIRLFLSKLKMASLKYEFVDDIRFSVWKKLLWNAAFNPLSVYYGGVDTRYLLTNDAAFRQVSAIMDEVIFAARFDNIELPNSLKLQMIENTLNMVPYKTSMCLDYDAGLPLEIDAILGHLILFVKQFGEELPTSTFIYNQLKSGN